MLITGLSKSRGQVFAAEGGASVSLINEAIFKKMWTDKTPKLGPTKVTLRPSGEIIKVLGELNVALEYDDQKMKLSLLMGTGNGPSLLG